MGEKIKLLASTLAHSNNALCLQEFVSITHLSVQDVAYGLDVLVAFHVFMADNSFHNTEVGDMVYMFADNESAQAVYTSVIG